MRLALLADIHGNVAALEAVLEHAHHQAVDSFLCLGDVVNCSPDSKICWDIITSLGCPILRGNHESYLYRYNHSERWPELHEERFTPVAFSAAQFSPEECEAFVRLPLSYRHEAFPDLVFCHASPKSEFLTITPFTSEEDISRHCTDAAHTIRAHNHRAYRCDLAGLRIDTIGSIGLPLAGGRDAEYAIVEVNSKGVILHHHRVPYDVDQSLRRLQGHLPAMGVIARMFYRELLTATNHIHPFWQWHSTHAPEEMGLTEAIEHYFSL